MRNHASPTPKRSGPTASELGHCSRVPGRRRGGKGAEVTPPRDKDGGNMATFAAPTSCPDFQPVAGLLSTNDHAACNRRLGLRAGGRFSPSR